jgi:hypothetical protein
MPGPIGDALIQMNVMMYGRSMGGSTGSVDHAITRYPGFISAERSSCIFQDAQGRALYGSASAQRLALIPIHGLHFVVSISQYFYKYK